MDTLMSTSDTTSKPIDPTGVNGQNQVPPEIASGGALLRGLDPSDPKDQALIRSTIKRRPKRWRGITDEVKDEIVNITLKAARASVGMIDSGLPDRVDAGVRGATSAAKTLAMMEGQCQADEHLDEKHARLDNGQATEAVKMYGVDAPLNDV